MKKIITSSIFSINFRDTIKGIIVAAGGSVVSVVETSLSAGQFKLDWKSIIGVGLAAGLSYIGKQFFTPSQTIIKE